MPRRLPISCLLALFVLSLLFAAPALAAEPSLDGWLSIVWGDRPAEALETGPTPLRVSLATDDGDSVPLVVSDDLLRTGVIEWSGRRVTVYPADARSTDGGGLRVAAVRLAADASLAGGVEGPQPWISILCKFSDVADEPADLAYFQGMYGSGVGGLDHYWREVSYDTVNVVGSVAVDWVTLPGTQTDYAPTPGSGSSADLGRVFNDCTAAVDDVVDFSNGGFPFVGINIMVNDLLDCCAWGGSRFATLDGVSQSWRTTWNPPWSFFNEAIIAHEMGHGFGLPHANNFDGDGNPYDSPWDVMSSATGYTTSDSTYGSLGKHVNAHHKDQLGWFPAARRFEPAPNTRTTITLDHTGLADSSNFQMVTIPVGAQTRYTVEARLRSGDYELALPGDAVIIHQVVTGRSEPAWAVDGDVPPANYGDNPGTMWVPGEAFVDAANGISIEVDSQTATGFVVTIQRGDPSFLFADGFESGDLTIWSVEP